MPTYRTPDVYVEEISVFPPSVAEVETAIPAFIGYTEKAARTVLGDLHLKPTKIYSLKEFESWFGGPKDVAIDQVAVAVEVSEVPDPAAPTDPTKYKLKVEAVSATSVTPPTLPELYLLSYSVQMFFANGGGKCTIVSVGTYGGTASFTNAAADLIAGLDAVAMEDEPTLLVIPEAVQLDAAGYQNVVQAMLLQCRKLGDRFAIFDLRDGDQEPGTVITANRNAWAGELKYGAAYYPFVRTTINHFVNPGETNVLLDVEVAKVVHATPPGTAKAGDKLATQASLASFATTGTAVYNAVKAALKGHFVVLPPSGAIAGVYAAVDTARGVWKAPANVALAGVLEPVVRLDNAQQDELNIDPTSGKSINALRAFSGKGTLVWGARTLSGNDNEWRYVPVRRFFNMVEESVKKSTSWAVFEPNDANTWVKVRGMIENYLLQKWREGALAGATPKDAFFVRCGLGTTMSAQDILEGRMHVEIGMAVVRPAEFIVLKFSHKLQTS